MSQVLSNQTSQQAEAAGEQYVQRDIPAASIRQSDWQRPRAARHHQAIRRPRGGRDLSFDVRPGEVFGFVGSNGAGKTTTMRVALGTLIPDHGSRPVGWRLRSPSRCAAASATCRRSAASIRRCESASSSSTWRSCTAPPRPQRRRRGARWLERFGLKERARDELQKLSHGNQQRVQLAAALVFEPVMLVLDEPFAGLDPEAVDSMSEVLHERAQAGIPVIFSSHQLELVERICDRVGIIQRGQLVACGTIDELRGRGPRQLWVDAPSAPPRLDRTRSAVCAWCELTAAGSSSSSIRRPTTRRSCAPRWPPGPVREFRHDVPSLLDIFREAMTESTAAVGVLSEPFRRRRTSHGSLDRAARVPDRVRGAGSSSIGTVLLMVLMVGYIVLQASFISRRSTTVKVGFVGAQRSLAQPLKPPRAAPRSRCERPRLQALRTALQQVRSAGQARRAGQR